MRLQHSFINTHEFIKPKPQAGHTLGDFKPQAIEGRGPIQCSSQITFCLKTPQLCDVINIISLLLIASELA